MDHKLMREGFEKFISSLGLAMSPKTRAKIVENLEKLWSEKLLVGYSKNPVDILNSKMPASSSDPVFITNISFVSTCQDHFLPFSGSVCIGYIPDREIAGLSSLVRMVQIISARLQLQENLTTEIAEIVYKSLSPIAVGVQITAQHFCVKVRYPSQDITEVVTTCFRGDFKWQDFREEFFRVISNSRRTNRKVKIYKDGQKK